MLLLDKTRPWWLIRCVYTHETTERDLNKMVTTEYRNHTSDFFLRSHLTAARLIARHEFKHVLLGCSLARYNLNLN